jgi:hypothetical protein
MIVRDQIENILFQVGSGRANSVDLTLPDHLCEGQPQFRCAHRAREREEHLPSLGQVREIRFRCVHDYSRVEVTVVVLDEFPNVHVRLSLRTLALHSMVARNPIPHASMIQEENANLCKEFFCAGEKFGLGGKL